MLRILFLITLLLIPFGAFAAEPMNVRQMCQRIAALQNAEAANYTPGVDLNGNPVASADLDPNMNNILGAVVIPVEVDLLKRFEVEVPRGVELEPDLAQIVVNQDGSITFNGQEITQRSAFICSEERLRARGIRSDVTIRGTKTEPDNTQKQNEEQSSAVQSPLVLSTQNDGNGKSENAKDGQPPLDAVNVENIPVMPPQDPLWNGDVMIGGQ